MCLDIVAGYGDNETRLNVEPSFSKDWIKGLLTGNASHAKPIVRHVAVLQTRTNIKIHTYLIPSSPVTQYLLLTLAMSGHMKVFNESEKTKQSIMDAETKKRPEEQRISVGDFTSTRSSVNQLPVIHGTEGGSAKKRRRYAKQEQNMLDTLFKIACTGLGEAHDGTDIPSAED